MARWYALSRLSMSSSSAVGSTSAVVTRILAANASPSCAARRAAARSAPMSGGSSRAQKAGSALRAKTARKLVRIFLNTKPHSRLDQPRTSKIQPVARVFIIGAVIADQFEQLRIAYVQLYRGLVSTRLGNSRRGFLAIDKYFPRTDGFG